MKDWFLTYNTNGYLYNIEKKLILNCLITSNDKNMVTIVTHKDNIATIYNFFNINNCHSCQCIPNLYCKSLDRKNDIIFSNVVFRNIRTEDSILYINISYNRFIRNKGFKRFDNIPTIEDENKVNDISTLDLINEIFSRFRKYVLNIFR